MNLSPEQKIRLHISGVINTYAKYPYLNRLIYFLLDNTNRKLSQEISDFFIRPLVSAQSSIIDEGVKAGTFKSVDPMCFYFTFIGACDIIFYGRASLDNVFQIGELTAEIRDRYSEFVAEAALRAGLTVAVAHRLCRGNDSVCSATRGGHYSSVRFFYTNNFTRTASDRLGANSVELTVGVPGPPVSMHVLAGNRALMRLMG